MMRRLLGAAAIAAALGALPGTARADTFVVGGTQPAVLPSAETPNAPGSLLLPSGWTVAATVQQTLSQAELSTLWRQAGAAYGISWPVLAAINKVETNFGGNMGPSSAGAVGWMQFMPDTWLRWGLDADGDGFADPWNPRDAIFAAARYLAAAGGREDLERAIFAYNHADWYVQQILELAALYGRTGSDVAFELDRMQVSLDAARERIAKAARKLGAARAVERRLTRRESALVARADRARLLSDELDLRKRATQLGVRLDAATARVDAARERLRDARQALEEARSAAQGAAFSPGAGTLLGTPVYRNGYVFPVGGGPSIVSVGHAHHDYPAADIAAPEGTPLYALADAVVTRAWAASEGNCGIGLIIETVDGQSWTYCHLSYLEPTVVDGSTLASGQPVGLVGSTGRSTGPHLHLQLNPTTSYPQEQAWFQSFAGIAFRWQDAPTPEPIETQPVFAAVSQPVFAVVEEEPSGDEPVFFTRTGG
jgi:murein DD-endopeptidase MepM/ murein hydrolase activator NlpD